MTKQSFAHIVYLRLGTYKLLHTEYPVLCVFVFQSDDDGLQILTYSWHSWALSSESFWWCHKFCDTIYSPRLRYVNTMWYLYKILLPLDHFRIEPKEWTRSWIQRKTQGKWDGEECTNRRLNRWQKIGIPRRCERVLFWNFKPIQYMTTDLPKWINDTYYC